MSDQQPFAEWIGRRSEAEDDLNERLVASFRAIFEPHLAPTEGDAAPLGMHWCLSPPIAGMAELGPDGHPAKNRHLPPVPQPRRMWAGGSLELLAPLRVGDRVRRVSTIKEITRKQGRSGELWFVAVEHEYGTARGLAIRERHDIVYREAARPGAAAPEPKQEPAASEPAAESVWKVETTPTLLFRYSAITFNGHRIHYDYPYATQVEGYPGLVVHGPIQATLLLNLAATRGPLRTFRYRGVAPAITGEPLLVCAGEGGAYWTQMADGRRRMEAQAAP